MRSEEKLFLRMVSFILKGGIFIFLFMNVISYLFLGIDPYFSRLIRYYSLFVLIITPLLRILGLGVGFLIIGEKRYSLYSFLVFLIVISGLIL